MRELLPCPFCGGEVSIALCGDGFDIAWWFITRGHGENACKCRLFMESEKFNKDSEMADFVADDLIAAWNRRSDAVPVVRCGECKYNTSEKKCLYPDSIIKIPDDNDFCSYGERKESEGST